MSGWAKFGKYVFSLMFGLVVAVLLLGVARLIGPDMLLSICIWVIAVVTTMALDKRLNR